MATSWSLEAICKLHAENNRSADTHLIHYPIPAMPGIDLYFKDESTHITGSLKHRLARSLFFYGIANGRIHQSTSIVEASSGNTAISEAFFAKLLGLRFIAVMAKSTSPQKIKRIELYGGECVFVDSPEEDCERANKLAKELKGHFMDQFTYAERATDWRGNNNIASSLFQQLEKERYPVPTWLVCGAGTGGTSATLGRYIHYQGYTTKLCVVDPPNSVFHRYYKNQDNRIQLEGGSGIEGIGRPIVSQSFIPAIIDKVITVPNEASIAAIHFIEKTLGKRCGGSTGTNLIGALQLAKRMQEKNQTGSIVTLICDDGKRYADTYYNDEWLQDQGYDLDPTCQWLKTLVGY